MRISKCSACGSVRFKTIKKGQQFKCRACGKVYSTKLVDEKISKIQNKLGGNNGL